MAHEFHGAKLQGADFRGKNLAESDFSHTDIRGADFSDAMLVGANFSNARAGLPTYWAICWAVLSLILSLFAGLVSSYGGALIGDLLNVHIYSHSFFGIVSLITLAIFLIVIFFQGLGATLATLAEVVAACIITALAFFPESAQDLSIGALFTTVALAGAMAGVGNMAVAVAIGRVMALPGARAFTGVMASIGTVLGTLLGVRSQESAYLIAGFVSLELVH